MPFEDHAARSFTAASIVNNAPEASGVFGLSNGREWVYVGDSANIRAQLLRILNERDGPIRERKPTGFSFELCRQESRQARTDKLVRELSPVCNRRAS